MTSPDPRLDGAFADAATHVLPVRVYYEDTDTGGIVYHANYLKFMERGRTSMLRLLGQHHTGLWAEHGVAFAVRRMTIDFVAPARLDDALEVVTRMADIRGASLAIAQSVRRAGQTLARADVKLAMIDRNARAVRIPATLRMALDGLGHGRLQD